MQIDSTINNENFLAGVISNVTEGIVVIDRHLNYVLWNNAMQTITGTKASEILGLSALTNGTFLHNGDIEQTLQRVLAGETISTNDVKMETNDINLEKWYKGTFSPNFDSNGTICGIVGCIVDITQRKKLEHEKDFNNDRLESLLRINQFKSESKQELLDHALQEAITLTESRLGYIYYYSEDKTEFTLNTWSKEAMEQCKIANPLTKYQLNSTGCWGEAVRQRKPFLLNEYTPDNEFVKGTPLGHVELKRFLTIPLIVEDEIVAVVGVANKTEEYNNSDIRQLTLLMDTVWKIVERQEHQQQLIAAKEKAEESDRLKTAFLANMSHEIRTPMNAIIGFAEMLNRPNLSDERRKYYTEIISENSNQLLAIVNDILDISRIETGQIEIREDVFNVNDMLLELYVMFKSKAAQKNISVYTHKEMPDHQVVIQSDEFKLRQILNNLIVNALKFTHKGSIKFGYTKVNEELHFFVEDTGIGIYDDMLDKIFERFRQADSDITRRYGGTGLGLSISKGYVELLGGKIWVESKPDVGTKFSFSLPYQPYKKLSEKTDRLRKTEDIKPDFDLPTILIAEDELMNYIYLEELLEDYNINLIHAQNGKQAVEMCHQHPEIQLILMDIRMPELNGYDATKQIKAFRPTLPIIAQSAFAMLNDHQKAKEAGCDDYITKPIDEIELLELLQKYVLR